MSEVLGPKELEERGLAEMFGPSPTLERFRNMNIIGEGFRNPGKAVTQSGYYTPEEDIIGVEADGRTYQIAAKGVPIPIQDAIARGLVKVNYQIEPTERKPKGGPSERKDGKRKDAAAVELVKLQGNPADQKPAGETPVDPAAEKPEGDQGEEDENPDDPAKGAN